SEFILKTTLDFPVEDNLIYKAYQLLSNTISLKSRGTTPLGAVIELHKEIPMQAGLGGGSSDAAAALIGLNRLWNCGFSINDLSTIGAKLGSDVPFFIEGKYAVIEGRGEIVTPLKSSPVYDIILIKPDFNISTSWAYQRITQYSKVTSDYSNKLDQALKNRDFAQIQLLMRNDFEPVLIEEFPMISNIKSTLIELGAVTAILSGSGSAIFGVYSDEKSALSALPKITSSYPNYLIKHTKTL
ncbi:MAG: 4-(cytidine 5'-diphospho)-2-C-methyl-D-erythritol kinase, partial [Nitrospirae bacterium]|nr:4-(cytidine 5'-diphospho)-2-C-methyl-D-erythritol kinase [Nitrospirota bacterium]